MSFVILTRQLRHLYFGVAKIGSSNLYPAWRSPLRTEGLMEHSDPELFEHVCREVAGLVPCDRISLALPSGDGARFVVLTVHPEGTASPTWEIDREGSCSAQVLKKRKAEFFPSLGTEFHYPEEEHLHRQGIRDAALLPLFLRGEPYCVLILGSSNPALSRAGTSASWSARAAWWRWRSPPRAGSGRRSSRR